MRAVGQTLTKKVDKAAIDVFRCYVAKEDINVNPATQMKLF